MGLYSYPVSDVSPTQRQALARLLKETDEGRIRHEQTVCPLCSAGRWQLLYANDRYGLPVRTVLCTSCGLVYTNPIMDSATLAYFYESGLYRDIYGGSVGADDRRFRTTGSKPFQLRHYSFDDSFHSFILETVTRIASVCEVGAAGGWNLARFAAEGMEVVGYEPDPRMCAAAHTHGIPVRQGFIDEMTGDYDLVFLRHVLEHVADPVGALTRVARHATKYVAVEVPGLGGQIPSIQGAHTVYFSPHTLRQAIGRAGLREIRLAQFLDNGFIMGLFEKSATMPPADINPRSEVWRVRRVWWKERVRFLGGTALRKLGLRRKRASRGRAGPYHDEDNR